jgi:tRNA1Val (adenine37-N6)-methyltransferase
MPNNYFSFKKFTIYQDNCAMKVCTDACIFGASFNKINIEATAKFSALDIGAGTGLLSMMLAQNFTNAQIDALEINQAAHKQSQLNFKNSAVGKNIIAICKDVNDYYPNKKYDFIFCNPPFFQNSLPTKNEDINTALHSTQLSLYQLSIAIDRLITSHGIVAILLPTFESQKFVELLQHINLRPYFILNVQQTPKHKVFRQIIFYSFAQKEVDLETMCIKNEANSYTQEFEDLLSNFYLQF